MLQSMTGFGEAQYESEGISLQVEIKSLNHRFLKTVVKLPDALGFAEPEVEKLVRNGLNRGAVTYVLHMKYTRDMGPYEINESAIQGYLKALEQIQTPARKDVIQVDLASLLALPGVCQLRSFNEKEHAAFVKLIRELTEQALVKLKAMRTEEGKHIRSDLQDQCKAIQHHLKSLKKLDGCSVNRYRDRLEKRVNEMLSDVNVKLDEDLLAREVALFAERSDINEETARLESHLKQFAAMYKEQGQVGRKMDFLTQEMLREANTIGSKANDARISGHVVEIKTAIDRLKEQIQNVE